MRFKPSAVRAAISNMPQRKPRSEVPRGLAVPMLDAVPVKYFAKLGTDLWAVLTDLHDGEWRLQLWGADNLQLEFGGVTSREAMEYAMSIIRARVAAGSTEFANRFRWSPLVTMTRPSDDNRSFM